MKAAFFYKKTRKIAGLTIFLLAVHPLPETKVDSKR